MGKYGLLWITMIVLLLGCTPQAAQRQGTNATQTITEATLPDTALPTGVNTEETLQVAASVPFTSTMLEQWQIEAPDDDTYHFTDRRKNLFDYLPEEQVNRDQFDLSPEEERVVGYWFGLDGVSPQDEGISFMNALGKSTFPNITLFPNKFFIISWFNNGPGKINREDEKSIDYLKGFAVRGKWEIKDGMVVLHYYQASIVFDGEKGTKFNLSSPFELPLVPVAALTEDNYCDQPFAALEQPAEIQSMIPYDKLEFTKKGAHYIKTYFCWEYSIGPPAGSWAKYSELYSKPAFLKSKGITTDDILTATEGRLLQEYWN